MKGSDGKPSSYGHLSFDEYEQDQVFTIDASQDHGQRTSGLAVNDNPDYPIGELLNVMDRTKNLSPDQQKSEIQKFVSSHGGAHQRLYLGRSADHSVELSLKDAQGHDRIVLQVTADGSAPFDFLIRMGR